MSSAVFLKSSSGDNYLTLSQGTTVEEVFKDVSEGCYERMCHIDDLEVESDTISRTAILSFICEKVEEDRDLYDKENGYD